MAEYDPELYDVQEEEDDEEMRIDEKEEVRMAVKKSANPIRVWNANVFSVDAFSQDTLLEAKDIVEKWLKMNCKEYAFQLEKGEETERMHFNITYSLKTKSRWAGNMPKGWSGRVAPVSKKTIDMGRTYIYAMKEDTRVEGPWVRNASEPEHIKKLYDGAVFLPWQQRFAAKLLAQDTREMMFVEDCHGGVGKSFVTGFLRHRCGAIMVPATCDTVQQMMGAVLDGLLRKTDEERMETAIVIVDIPRCLSKNLVQIEKLITALEQIKNGYVCDTRGKTREMCIVPPIVAAFYNGLPPKSKLSDFVSKDRIVEWNDFGTPEEQYEALSSGRLKRKRAMEPERANKFLLSMSGPKPVVVEENDDNDYDILIEN